MTKFHEEPVKIVPPPLLPLLPVVPRTERREVKRRERTENTHTAQHSPHRTHRGSTVPACFPSLRKLQQQPAHRTVPLLNTSHTSILSTAQTDDLQSNTPRTSVIHYMTHYEI